MAAVESPSPPESSILVRKVAWEFPDHLDDVFEHVDLPEECARVALSLTLPHLEPYLVRTLRSALEHVRDPALAADVRAFCAQEAQHHRGHARVNAVIREKLGARTAARLAAIEAALEADYRRFGAERSLAFNLGYAEGFEAMTCAMALARLEDPEPPTRVGPWQELWSWHLAEEIEHRTVAFDVFEHVVGSYPRRVALALAAQAHFFRYLDRLHRVLVAHHGRRRRVPYVPRMLRAGFGRYLRTFAPGYDPAAVETPAAVAEILARSTP